MSKVHIIYVQPPSLIFGLCQVWFGLSYGYFLGQLGFKWSSIWFAQNHLWPISIIGVFGYLLDESMCVCLRWFLGGANILVVYNYYKIDYRISQ